LIYLKALLALIPLIRLLVGAFVKSPEEKQKQLVLDVHEAVTKSKSGDTSAIEKLIVH